MHETSIRWLLVVAAVASLAGSATPASLARGAEPEPAATPAEPPPCPRCGSRHVVPIVYGLPTEDDRDRADGGEIALGGCVVSPASPRWRCRACGRSFGRLGDGRTAG